MTVFAVPRELRHRLNKRLLEQTLHELRQWFIQRADLAGEEGGESFSVLYDETPDALRHEVQSNLAPMVLSRKSGRDIGKRC